MGVTSSLPELSLSTGTELQAPELINACLLWDYKRECLQAKIMHLGSKDSKLKFFVERS
jgi:hypothetical protein